MNNAGSVYVLALLTMLATGTSNANIAPPKLSALSDHLLNSQFLDSGVKTFYILFDCFPRRSTTLTWTWFRSQIISGTQKSSSSLKHVFKHFNAPHSAVKTMTIVIILQKWCLGQHCPIEIYAVIGVIWNSRSLFFFKVKQGVEVNFNTSVYLTWHM